MWDLKWNLKEYWDRKIDESWWNCKNNWKNGNFEATVYKEKEEVVI